MKQEDIQKIELKDGSEMKIIVEETATGWTEITIKVFKERTIIRTTKNKY